MECLNLYLAAAVGVGSDVVHGVMLRDSIATRYDPWIFACFTSWIQALQDNEGKMNTIGIILVLEFSLFTVVEFLEAAEFGIEIHKTYDPGVSLERRKSGGVLLEIPVLIRACFSVERLCRLLHTCGANVECPMHAYRKSFGVYLPQLCGREELWKAGPYLYYYWKSGKVVNVGARQDTFHLIDDDWCPIRKCFRILDLVAM